MPTRGISSDGSQSVDPRLLLRKGSKGINHHITHFNSPKLVCLERVHLQLLYSPPSLSNSLLGLSCRLLFENSNEEQPSRTIDVDTNLAPEVGRKKTSIVKQKHLAHYNHDSNLAQSSWVWKMAGVCS